MKTTKLLIVILCAGLLILSACNTADKPSADAPAENESSVADEPASVEPVEEPDETSIEVSLLDTEAMLENLGSYLLRPDDLPNDYIVPADGERHVSNTILLQEMGEIEAKTFIKDTGRIDGWFLEIDRVNKIDFVPGFFQSAIELFDSVDGPNVAISPEYASRYVDASFEYTPVDGGCEFGDTCEFYSSEQEDPITEEMITRYYIAFTYKNAFVWVKAKGFTIDMETDYFLDAVQALFEKLEAAPTQ